MNAVIAITLANLRRLVADRANIFWLIGLPLLIMFGLGLAFGGNATNYLLGVSDPAPTSLSRQVADQMSRGEGITMRPYDSPAAVRDAVANGRIDAGWAVSGDTFSWFAGASFDTTTMQQVFVAAVHTAGVDRAVVATLAEQTGAPEGQVSSAYGAARAPSMAVRVVPVGSNAVDPKAVRSVLAGGQLTLFIFLTALNSAEYLFTSRQYGVTRRTRAAPVTVSSMVIGEGMARFLTALIQAAILVGGSALLFGVHWGSPGTVALLCGGMALVGTGAAMLLGSAARTIQGVGAFALLVSLSLAALGGSMQPIHFFPQGLQRIAQLTPHGQMNTALWAVLVDGQGLGGVWTWTLALYAEGLLLTAAAVVVLARKLR